MSKRAESIIVGKNILESLTVGMYSDSYIIFREYIQNATDAIDQAVENELIEKDDGKIKITIDRERREIRFKDNGIGISEQDVHHTLGDIGKSEKNYADNRGFRGIGRLGGLGYCTELRFVTSYAGENTKTEVSWDARKLKKLLQPNNKEFENVIDLVQAVTIQSSNPEAIEKHYFEVILSGISFGHENLLDVESVEEYLAQVAPVPFDYSLSGLLQKVNMKLDEMGVPAEEYAIFLSDTNISERIYKPYKHRFLCGKAKNAKDSIHDIEFFYDYTDNGRLLFVGWYAKTNLSGMVKENNINGLRIRKRNILIGNNRTADIFFGQNRTYQIFNRWFVGEIYIFDNEIIPNARRDNFEKNEAYFLFKEKLEKHTLKLAQLPHPTSYVRSTEKKLKEASEQVERIQQELETSNGITEARKEKLQEEVSKLIKKTEKINPSTYEKNIQKISQRISEEKASKQERVSPVTKKEDVKSEKDSTIKKLEELSKKIDNTKNYVADYLPSTISRKCRKNIDVIFNVIDRILDEGLANDLKSKIVQELKQNSKTR